jgi:hypothetical protein
MLGYCSAYHGVMPQLQRASGTCDYWMLTASFNSVDVTINCDASRMPGKTVSDKAAAALTLRGVIQVWINAPCKHVSVVSWLCQRLLQHLGKARITKSWQVSKIEHKRLAQLQRPAQHHNTKL